MTNRMSPPVTPSAAAHAERIRARTEERAAEQTEATAGQSTAERIAARILPGYRADEALREQARLSELRARGVIGSDPEPEGVEDEYEEYDDEAPEDVEEDDEPVSTAERYARRERARQRAEHTSNRAAQSSAVRAWSPTPVVRPHRYANGWGPKPAA